MGKEKRFVVCVWRYEKTCGEGLEKRAKVLKMYSMVLEMVRDV